MKRFFLKGLAITVLLVAVSVNATAQWFMGGEVGFSVRDENSNETINNIDRTTNYTGIGFNVAPKGGYYFNEKFALGLSFNVGGAFASWTREDGHKFRERSVNWGIYPFVRYSVFTYKKFSVLLEGYTGVGCIHSLLSEQLGSVEAEAINTFLVIAVLNVTPILSFTLTDHLQMEAGLRFLNVGYNINISKGEAESYHKSSYTKHDFNIGFNSANIFSMSQLTIGVIYKF